MADITTVAEVHVRGITVLDRKLRAREEPSLALLLLSIILKAFLWGPLRVPQELPQSS